ncbi:5-carboxymethyl-2-hydroxymuconate Delta-isomerase [Chitiniphilus purpureus]|uniref:5-carboxymethyl-2-hydroxymuconate Delta-isomerase n=1 Tax=Chitiniphilus purpureus TaxID=2981137 RepID=A0ABY6DPE0_9NEIS|nr:5-carboxymethyl-2-hydroxymuconate Delta-isomerase [Chitiniphilus sp. CD1]UXY14961.1 5-carboxymethyl-2-hydroxymuconate Delta-isomerase [Chitiniphilus sp. CD1]
MPHLTLEYTNNLPDYDAQAALRTLAQAMFESGLFGEADIKGRAHCLATYLVGTSDTATAFVHLQVALLSGRSAEQKQALGQHLLAALRTTLPPGHGAVQLTVDTRDMDRQSYAKAVLAAVS